MGRMPSKPFFYANFTLIYALLIHVFYPKREPVTVILAAFLFKPLLDKLGRIVKQVIGFL